MRLIKQIIILAFCFVLGILYLNSSTWFRFKLADAYIAKQDFNKAISIYKEVLRKENLRHQMSGAFKKTIALRLEEAYRKSSEQDLYKVRSGQTTDTIENNLPLYERAVSLSKDYENFCREYSLPKIINEDWKNKRADVYFSLGKFFFCAGKLNESLDTFRNLAVFCPSYQDDNNLDFGNAKDYTRLGLALTNCGLDDSAIIEFKKFLRLAPKDPLGHYRLALIYQRKGFTDKAYKEFQMTARLLTGLSDYYAYDLSAFLGKAQYYLALYYEKKGEQEKAASYYENALLYNKQIVDAYQRLCLIYEKQGNEEAANKLKSRLINLKPEYGLTYHFAGKISFLGYSYDKIEFEMFPELGITFHWQVNGKVYERKSGIEAASRTDGERLYQLGEKLYQIKRTANLAANPGFEIDRIGVGAPAGWSSDLYSAPENSYNIAADNLNHYDNQFLIMDNSLVRRTGRQAGPIAIDQGSYYLESGRIKDYNASGHLGRQWRRGIVEISFNYVDKNPLSQDWNTYSQIVKPPANAQTCYLWMLNYETSEKACFDDILFIELKAPEPFSF